MRGRRGRRFGFILRQAGFKMTRPRDVILDLFMRYPNRHMSAEDILFLGHQLGIPGLSLATIYRNLELLERLGILRRINVDGVNKYEIIEEPEEKHHHHIICLSCRRVINYSEFLDEEVELIKKIEQKIEQKYGVQIKRHDLTFYGICKDCMKEVIK